MNLRLNRNLFMQTGADSGALGMLGTVVHRPRASGDYAGSVYLGDHQVGEFTLRVLDEESPMSVQVDLADQQLLGATRRNVSAVKDDCDCAGDATQGAGAVYTVGRQGYVVFHVSAGSGGFHVQLAGPMTVALLERSDDDRARGDVWSSRELAPGDMFAVTLLRPGTYKVTNERGGEGKLRLGYPERGKTAYRPPDALRIAVTDGGFEPAGFELQPMQGQVYEIQAPARINITLVEPEDREPPSRPDRTRPTRFTLRRKMARLEVPPRESSPADS